MTIVNGGLSVMMLVMVRMMIIIMISHSRRVCDGDVDNDMDAGLGDGDISDVVGLLQQVRVMMRILQIGLSPDLSLQSSVVNMVQASIEGSLECKALLTYLTKNLNTK